MKKSLKVFLAFTFACAMALPAVATITTANNTVGTATSFPTYSIGSGYGTLFFQSILASPAGATIPGGGSQGYTANQGFGEIFYYTGPGDTLTAVSMIDNGGGGTATFQPFFFDLGTSIYNAGSTLFNPSLQVNLFGTQTVTPPAFGSANFLEFDLGGGDAITLTTGHSYAFGLMNNNNDTGMTFRRASGVQSDPNGDGFVMTSFSATSDNASPWGGGPRNMFVGVYTTPIPEPSSVALLGVGLASLLIRRRKG